MKNYQHIRTPRHEIEAERAAQRAQAGFEFISALFVCLAVYAISVAVLS